MIANRFVEVLTICVSFFAFQTIVHASEIEFFVAMNGMDRNSGSEHEPFRTLAQAKKAVIEVRRRAGNDQPKRIVVTLLDGRYSIRESLQFGRSDSGTIDSPVIYRARNPGGVRLSGGIELPEEGFEVVSDPRELGMFSADVAKRLLKFKLANVVDKGQIPAFSLARNVRDRSEQPASPELIFDYSPMTVARWPNVGWANVSKVSNENGDSDGRAIAFIPVGGEVSRWIDSNVWMKGYWAWDWYDQALPIRSIEPKSRQVQLTEPPVYGIRAGGRFYVVNAPRELDGAGEYYININDYTLYFLPPEPIEGRSVELTDAQAPLLSFKDAEYIVFEGMVIENGRDGGISIIDGTNIEFRRCVIRNFGTYGIGIAGGRNHSVVESEIHSTGTRGIGVSGGSRNSLVRASHIISSNHFFNIGRRIAASQPAIDVDGVGVSVSRNHIHDIPQIAVMFGGNDHLIDSNLFEDVCLEVSDAGAVYTGRDWTAQGTIVRDNVFRNIRGLNGHGDVSAIYLDDLASGILVSNNSIENTMRGVLIGGGRDNIVSGNVFRFVDVPVSVDSRGVHWGNKLLAKDGVLMKRLKRVPYGSQKWRSSYPELRNILHDDPALPKRNRIVDNLLYRSGTMSITPLAKVNGVVENNIQTDSDPGSRDVGNRN